MKKLLPLLLILSFTIKAQDVTIGEQTWTSKNLDVSNYRNGEAITLAQTDSEWKAAGEKGKPAYCYYQKKGSNYGKLYNWYAVIDSRGLAPKGYHIPTDDEWTKLKDYLGEAGTKMKSNSGWQNNGNGSNSSGFAGLPGGHRLDGGFVGVGTYGYWWSSTRNFAKSAWGFYLTYFSGDFYNFNNDKRDGFSVRCLRD